MKNLIEKTSQLTQRGAVSMRLNRPEFRRQRGASAIEYVVIAAVIALGIFFLGGETILSGFESFFQRVSDVLTNAGSGDGST